MSKSIATGRVTLIEDPSLKPGEIIVKKTANQERREKYAKMSPEERKIQALETEIKQLKRGQGATDEDWQNMSNARLNEIKFRQFKANLVAHKKLCQIIAGKLANAGENGLTADECLAIAYTLEPNANLYISSGSVNKLKDDIGRLLGHE